MSYFITNTDHVCTSVLYRKDSEYLQHGLFNWGKHKYIKRTGTPGHYVYTYAENVRNAGRNLVSRARSTARNILGVNQRSNAVAASNNYKAALDSRERARRAVSMPSTATNPVVRSRTESTARTQLTVAENQLDRARSEYTRAMRTYQNTPMGAVETHAFSRLGRAIFRQVSYQFKKKMSDIFKNVKTPTAPTFDDLQPEWVGLRWGTRNRS